MPRSEPDDPRDGAAPPALLEALLRRLVPPEHRDAVQGDLREEHAARGGGAIWYALQVAEIGLRLRLASLLRGDVTQELRLAVRKLVRDRTLTAVAVLALALGVGLNAVILSVADTVLFSPLPYPAAERLGVLTNEHTGSSTGGFGVSYLNMRDVEERSSLLEDHALFLDWQDVHYTRPDAAFRIPATFVDDAYFRLLGLEAGLGRLIAPDENREGAAARVAVLGHGTWQRVFGGDPGVVGRSIRLNGLPYEVVGVTSDDRGDLRYRWNRESVGVYLPLFATEELTPFELRRSRGLRVLNALYRVRPGASMEGAQEELLALSEALAAEHPRTNDTWEYDLQALDEAFYEQLRAPTGALLAGSALVLLLVGVNVVNLLLIRAAGRGREIAVRRALGAHPLQLLRQLLAEGLVLAAAGGLLGGALAMLGLEALDGAALLDLPTFAGLEVGSGTLLLSVAVTLVLGVGFGLVPGLSLLRTSGPGDLRTSTARSESRRTGRLKEILIAGEVALAFVLLVGAGLMLESFRTLRATGYGFDSERLLLARFELRGDRWAPDDARQALARTLMDRGAAVPGVEASFIWSPNRLGHGNQVELLTRRGRWEDHPDERLEASQHLVHPGTLDKLGIPLVEGRDFTPADGGDGPRVAIVSESLARAFFPDGSPLGRFLETPSDGEYHPIEIVGVVADARHRTRLTEPFGPQRDIYYPFAQEPSQAMTLALRLGPGADDRAVAAEARNLLREAAPEVPLYDLTTMEAEMREEESRARLAAFLVSLYAALAIALAALGVYGVLAHGVRRRTREIGIRMALGADRPALLRRVVGRGLALALLGGVVGVAGALAGSRLLASALYGVEPWDEAVFLSVGALLATVALVATLVPALRATRVDPSEALAAE